MRLCRQRQRIPLFERSLCHPAQLPPQLFGSSDTSDLDGELDRTIGESLLHDRMATLASFNPGFLNSIHLQQSVQFALLAPSALIIVEGYLSRDQIADNGIVPAGQLNAEA